MSTICQAKQLRKTKLGLILSENYIESSLRETWRALICFCKKAWAAPFPTAFFLLFCLRLAVKGGVRAPISFLVSIGCRGRILAQFLIVARAPH